MTKEEIEKAQSIAEGLINDMGIVAKVKASFDEESAVLNLDIDSEEAAVLIGFHGETLQSLQLILSLMVHQSLGRWTKVLVNVGDYRQKREEQLRKLALNLAMKVKFSGESQVVPNLTASERRIVHLILTDHPDVYSESEGEGEQRQLFIKAKTVAK